MPAGEEHLIGVGLYTISEAAALTGASAQAIRRWLCGYRFAAGDHQRAMSPVWKGDIPAIEGHVGLSFLDLMEARFILAFRQHRVTWPAIRQAAVFACEMFGDGHPFTRRQFKTDGVRIFQRIEESIDVKLFDLNRRSWVFHDIVSPSLYAGVEFAEDQVSRWFPMWPKKTIVMDPRIGFGRPMITKGEVPTDVLSAAAKAEGSITAAARWYRVSPVAVRAAVAFEDRLAA